MKHYIPFITFCLVLFYGPKTYAQFTVSGLETICSGTSATLTAANCAGTLKWSTGETTANITVNPGITTTYFVTCTVGTSSTTGSLTPIVVGGLQLNTSAGICFTDQTTLSMTPLPIQGQARWERDGVLIPNVNGSTYDATQAGTYTVNADLFTPPAWSWQNLLPDGNDFNDIYFADDFVGVAVGDFGKIVRTTDSGETWTKVFSYEQFDYTSVHFVNSTTGWLTSRGGQVFKTTDAGLTWSQVYQNGSYYNLTEVFFTDADHGWISDGNSGSLLRTTNGGVSWQASASGVSNPTGVFFTDNTNGWVVGSQLRRTTDGGVTWNLVNLGNGNFLYDVFFVSSSVGWVVGSGNACYKTIDGGGIWVSKGNLFPANTNFTNVFFTDENNGILLSSRGIYKTTNGGNAWTLTDAPATSAKSVFMRSPSRAWVAGQTGRLLTGYSTPTSYGWKVTRGEGVGLESEPGNVYPEMDFVNSQIGWVINGRSFLLKTTNGGKVWTNSSLKEVYDVDFVDAAVGYAAVRGSSGNSIALHKSFDGGNSWNPIYNLPGNDVAQIQFVSANVGWAIVGYTSNPNVYRTTNGGSTWASSSVGFNVDKLFFQSASVGWVSGTDGKVAKTTDGGVTWTPVSTGTESAHYTINEIYFKDNSFGWLTGSNTRKTTDGGLTWSANMINGVAVGFRGISFADANHGMALSYYRHPQGGYIYYRTTDGGTTWQQERIPSGTPFYDIVHTDPANAWVSNGKGGIMHYAAPTATCEASITLQQSPPAPQVTASTHNALCEGESITLTASGCPDALSWSDGSVGETITVTPYASTTFTAFCGENSGCQGATNMGVAVVPTIQLDTTSAAPCNRPVFTATNFWSGLDIRWLRDGSQVGYQASSPYQNTSTFAASGVGTYTAEPMLSGAWASQTGALSIGTLLDTNFPTSETGFAVGSGGAILKSTDGGTGWKTLSSGTFSSLRRISMVTSLVGWAWGNDITLKTTDGGATWVKQKMYFNDISFFSETIGWAVKNNIIYYTSDGGNQWITQNGSGSAGYSAVQASSATTAWALRYNSLLKTTDAGQTWTAQDPAGVTYLSHLYFIDQNHGWVVGSSYFMAYTSDGGASWTRLDLPRVGYGNIHQVQFMDTNHGWVKIDEEYILSTADGGQSWSTSPKLSAVGISGYARFYLKSAREGFVTGDRSIIARTTDGAATWRKASGNLTGFLYSDFRDVHFTDSDHGLVVGNNRLLLNTSNGGKNWSVRKLVFNNYYLAHDLFFVNATHGWIIGNDGIVLRTTDGGNQWSKGQLPFAPSSYYRVFFINTSTGWVVGNYGLIFKTIDGGISWAQQTASLHTNLLDVHFTDQNRGWITGANGTILATTNGGTTWTSQNSGFYSNLTSVYFTSATEGWAVGGPNLLHTTDGGSTWQNAPQIMGTTTGHFFSRVQFVNENTGFVSGNQVVYATYDKGLTWKKSYHHNTLTSMHFADATHGWVIGSSEILSYRPAAAPCPSDPVVVTPQTFPPLSTLASGTWNTPGVWSCGQVPTSLDAVLINSEHTITLPDGYSARAKSAELRGSLIQENNSGLQMGQE